MAPSVLEKYRTFGFVELTTRLRKLHACISDTDTSHSHLLCALCKNVELPGCCK